MQDELSFLLFQLIFQFRYNFDFHFKLPEKNIKTLKKINRIQLFRFNPNFSDKEIVTNKYLKKTPR